MRLRRSNLRCLALVPKQQIIHAAALRRHSSTDSIECDTPPNDYATPLVGFATYTQYRPQRVRGPSSTIRNAKEYGLSLLGAVLAALSSEYSLWYLLC